MHPQNPRAAAAFNPGTMSLDVVFLADQDGTRWFATIRQDPEGMWLDWHEAAEPGTVQEPSPVLHLDDRMATSLLTALQGVVEGSDLEQTRKDLAAAQEDAWAAQQRIAVLEAILDGKEHLEDAQRDHLATMRLHLDDTREWVQAMARPRILTGLTPPDLPHHQV